MALTAKATIQRAAAVLQDELAVRWATAELVRCLNDAQRDIAMHRPDALATTATIALVAGARQTLPATAIKLIDIPNNATGTKRTVRQIQRADLDALAPEWRSAVGSLVVRHFMHDQRAPRVFDVWPPAAVGASLDVVYAAYPADVPEPPPGSTSDAVAGVIGVPDIYACALLDLVLWRAYMKETEYAGNVQRAEAHRAAAAAALGIDISALVTVSPGVANPGGVATA